MIVCTLCTCNTMAAGGDTALMWNKEMGVQIKTPIVTVQWDRNDKLASLVLKFTNGSEVPLQNPQVMQSDDTHLKLSYQLRVPDGTALKIIRELVLNCHESEVDLIEDFQLIPEKTLTTDLEIERPFAIVSAKVGSDMSAVCPLYNGWARRYSLTGKSLAVEYRIANVLGSDEVERLALPVIQLDEPGSWCAAISSDCRFSTLFSISTASKSITQGTVRYRYACGKVPLKGTETRSFGLWLAQPAPSNEPFGRSVDSFFRLMLPDVPPGPKWLHEIAMVYYDYLSENGLGWERDINELARLLKPQERRRVALCLHGWYESIGAYGFDDDVGKMKTDWIAMARTRKVHLSQSEMIRRMRLAKELGFRVLLYFADGLLQDSNAPYQDNYHDDWDLKDADGKRQYGWEGPDTWGRTHVRNPAIPEVVRWYKRYLNALLDAYGSEVDGFVWDETNYIMLGRIARYPEPSYCDRAMIDLVKVLRQQVKSADPKKVFLVADGLAVSGNGVFGNSSFAMVADGTYQDATCLPYSWSYAFFPNWRNTVWSCNWYPLSHFRWTKWSVENLGTPVAISNGYGDDKGPSEWDAKTREDILELFRERLTKTPVRFLTENPTKLLTPPSDPIPAASLGEMNWALASNGGKAIASSQYDLDGANCGPMGLIDGVRDDANWLKGHGWASRQNQPLPQWVEISFPQPRIISRFVIVNFGSKNNPLWTESFGVRNYDIEIWDPVSNSWKSVVSENKDRIMINRVHILEKPASISKFRVMIRDSVDGIARLLQVEAWGKE